jgi:hypothetical protein
MPTKKHRKILPLKKRKPVEPNVLITGRNAVLPREMDYFKPARYRNHLTLAEMAREIPCDPSWLRKLERAGRIPMAQRVQRGKLSIRLWSPEQRDEIKKIMANHQVGRPPKDR